MVVTETKAIPSWRETSLLCIVANALSIFGGMLIGTFLNEILWASNLPPRIDGVIIDGIITNPIQRALIVGISIGAVKGILEWFVLRRYESKWKGWLPISMLAWAIGVTIAAGLPEIHPDLDINEFVGGALIGLIQWSILRQHAPQAYWWIIATVVGSFVALSYIPLGYTFLMILESFIVFLINGLFIGIITGPTMARLLQESWLREQ